VVAGADVVVHAVPQHHAEGVVAGLDQRGDVVGGVEAGAIGGVLGPAWTIREGGRTSLNLTHSRLYGTSLQRQKLTQQILRLMDWSMERAVNPGRDIPGMAMAMEWRQNLSRMTQRSTALF
jgi:hypothetical protein